MSETASWMAWHNSSTANSFSRYPQMPAGFHGLHQVGLLVDGQRDDGRSEGLSLDALGRFDAIHLGHIDLHHDHIRSDHPSSTDEYGRRVLDSLGQGKIDQWLVCLLAKRHFVPLLQWRVGLQTVYGNGTNFLKKGEAVMATMNEASWIDTNVEVVESYLKKEFENFSIAHRAEQSLKHTFTVTDGKKLFMLFIGWPILADRSFTRAGIDLLSKQNIAEEMRLHGEDGYHWRPSN